MNPETMFETLQGLTSADLLTVRAALAACVQREDPCFALNYWSAQKRALLVVTYEEGELADWLLMACPTAEAVPELLRWWTEQTVERLQDREASAHAALAQLGDRARDERH